MSDEEKPQQDESIKHEQKREWPLHIKMGIGFAAGLIAGLIVFAADLEETPFVEFVTTYLTAPFGTLFLNLIFMLIVPLLFSALVMGVNELGSLRSLGRVGIRSLLYTLVFSSTAVLIGLLTVNLLKPGAGVDPELGERLLEQNEARSRAIIEGIEGDRSAIDVFLEIVPSNFVAAAADNGSILAVMFFALFFGVGMILTDQVKVAPLRAFFDGLFEVSMTMISLVIRLAPYAVFCFMFNLAAIFGLDLIIRLGAFVGVVLLALGMHMFITYPVALRMSGNSPRKFFRETQEATLMAFSTASSNATLPTSLKVANEMGLPPQIGRFVLTVGASANQNGTALFEGVTVLFLAQFFGVELALLDQALVMVICILGGIGTAGVPSGSLPVIALICGMVGVNPVGIGIILGVNHFLDMCRTSLNVTGDLVLAVLVAEHADEAKALPQS